MRVNLPIDTDIPPPKQRAGALRFPFDELAIGASFFILDPDAKLANRVNTQVFYHNQRGDKRFTSRRVDGGQRVWRLP